ncbi:HNH endonuclease signature motif containing protein [Geodermatophilus sp. URMC 64]
MRGVGGSGVLSFAGCGAPHYWCEVHHVIHWLFGGETDLENSGLLCERHHTQVHHGFRIERDTAGRWHTYRPDGTEILVIRPTADDPRLARAG